MNWFIINNLKASEKEKISEIINGMNTITDGPIIYSGSPLYL